MNRISYLFSLLILSLTMNAQSRIISVLEIYDTETNERMTIREFPYLIEAPNWSPDGKWLIYNHAGRLYRMDSEGKNNPIEINTGFATQCNNDHVISSDGKVLGISHAEGDWKTSRVYVLPFEGGQPREVTPLCPSFLHGMSPDGKEVAYCAFRGDAKAIYVKDVNGGEERCLTTAAGLNDGPEYSPDGKYIWFNSVRTGLMQVWRMRRDGSRQKQMTHDEDLNSWFPHVSPDGRQVVYIAYHKGDLKPDEHLPNKNVVLRLMSSKGKHPRTIVELFGGQGTINVNSWAPDSKRFAFVSYRLSDK